MSCGPPFPVASVRYNELLPLFDCIPLTETSSTKGGFKPGFMFAAQVVQTEEVSPIGSPIVNPSKSSQ